MEMASNLHLIQVFSVLVVSFLFGDITIASVYQYLFKNIYLKYQVIINNLFL